jgi:RND superfamily putative drug exporter
VPATMELLGDRNWWLPTWLDRMLPNIDIEGRPHAVLDHRDEPTSDVLVRPRSALPPSHPSGG